MFVAEKIRTRFLMQNSFTDDAFFDPKQTYELIRKIVEMYDNSLERINNGEPLAEVLQKVEL